MGDVERLRAIILAMARNAWVHDTEGDFRDDALRALHLVGVDLSEDERDALEDGGDVEVLRGPSLWVIPEVQR